MTLLPKITFLILLIPTLGFAATVPANFSMVGPRAIQEEDVTFKYASADGTIELTCTHFFDKPEYSDWDVWCGKGTKLMRQFRVHFLVRQYQNRSENRSAFEVLYWVIDRNQNMSKAFSSTSTWIQFNNLSALDTMSFSQGVENDYAYLKIDFKP